MRRSKLIVFLIFISIAFIFYGQQWLITASAGRNPAGGAPIYAPKGVSASDADYIDKVSVMWNTVRGAALYRVFRSTTSDPSTAVGVGTTAANYFFDTTAVAGQNYFYWVRAENGTQHSGLSTTDAGLRTTGSFHSQIFSPLSPPPVPVGNSVTAAKASLGKTLFWDEQLSSILTVSCGTCHRPATGGSDPRTVFNDLRSRNPGFDNTFNTPDDVFGSPGVPLNNQDGTYSPSNLFGFGEQVTTRKAPSYLNAALTSNGSFWDGRASNTFRDPLSNAILLTDWGALESQSLVPPVSSAEMAHGNQNWTQIALSLAGAKPMALASRIPPSLANWIDGRSYPELFEDAFGTPEVTPARIALAIATHERTLFSDRTPLDRWASLIEPLTAQEDRGRIVYTNVNCSFCHGGPLLSDQNFHNIGVRPQAEDRGRGAVTGNSNDNARFKTPTLRNVELRAPLMHNGRFATLEEVVEFYNRGGDFNAPNINRGLIRPLNLTAEQKADLVAFLKRPLTDLRVKNESVPFDRPQLYTESTRVPVVTGDGREGSGGITPQVTAIEPPLIGNPSFTVAVSSALGGTQAVLVIDSNDPGVGIAIPANGSFARVSVDISGSGAGNGYGSVSLPIPNDPALIGQTFYGRWYMTDAGAANGFSVTRAFRFQVFGAASTVAGQTPFDFDGDGKTDISIYRPSLGQWWIDQSTAGVIAHTFGNSLDKITPGDFTGDGKTDVAIWRPSLGEWFVLRSDDFTFYSFPFGISGDIPVPADYDGDNKADAAVFRLSTSTWYIQRSSGGTTIEGFGAAGDLPVPADYDGDGQCDIAVYRPNLGQWWLNRSTAGVIAVTFGTSEDRPVQGDYTGDGLADPAIWRPASGEWFILRSEDSTFYSFPFGTAGDAPAPGDYDGDGRFDAAIFRPANSTWYLNQSTQGIKIAGFGLSTDRPVPNAFVP